MIQKTRSNQDALRWHTSFIAAISRAATCFGCTKQASSGRMYKKYKKDNYTWCLWDRASLEQRCKQPTRWNKFHLLIFLNQLYMFRATNSPILRRTFWLYIQLLVQCADIAADRQQYRWIVPKAVCTVKKTCSADLKRWINGIFLHLVGCLYRQDNYTAVSTHTPN